MPRPPRIFIPGLSAHVYQRGHNRTSIFEEDRDFERFLGLVRQAASRFALDIHAFAVMNNHYHLITTPREQGALPAAMKVIDGGYTRVLQPKASTIGDGLEREIPIEADRG